MRFVVEFVKSNRKFTALFKRKEKLRCIKRFSKQISPNCGVAEKSAGHAQTD